MGQHAVVPPATPMLLAEGLFALWRVFRRVDTVCGWQRRAPARWSVAATSAWKAVLRRKHRS